MRGAGWLMVAVMIGCGAAGAAAHEPRRSAGAHVHGAGRLALAIEGTRIGIELEAPAHDVLGFEHAPVTASEKAVLDKAIAKMKDAASMFRTPAAAGCKTVAAEAGLEPPPAGAGQTHSDFRATIELACAAPEKLSQIELQYFAAFREAGKLDITVITQKGQATRTATRAKPTIDLKGLN